MKKYYLLLLFFSIVIPSSFAQLKTHTFEEAEKLVNENPKPIVVFIHTSWCKYCKMMQNTTFKNEEAIALLKENFYFISLDAEQKEDILFRNHNFKYIPNGANTGVHELATALATINSQVIYPTLTILESDYSIVFQKASSLTVKELLIILKKTK